MASNDNRITSGSGGNTAGTGGANHSGPGEGAGVGAAGRDGAQSEESERSQAFGGGSNQDEGPGSDDLAHADQAVRDAVEGGVNAAGTGGTSGKHSSEGTGAGGGNAPGGGDPGGMGGAGATPPNHDNRPPGGVSPLASGGED